MRKSSLALLLSLFTAIFLTVSCGGGGGGGSGSLQKKYPLKVEMRWGDGSLVYSISYTYDTKHNVLTRTDANSGGVITLISTYAYDANSRKTSTKLDNEGDGTVETYYTFTYDANGNLTETYYDKDKDGVAESLGAVRAYDGAGNMIQQTYRGWYDIVFLYTYDARGNMLSQKQVNPSNLSQVYNWTEWTYDSHDNILTWGYDSNNDSVIDQSGAFSYVYSSGGLVLEKHFDDGANGTFETHTTYTYDKDGNILTETESAVTSGTIISTITYFY